VRELAAQFLALAEKQGVTGPLMIGYRLVGTSVLLMGEIAAVRAHFDQAIGLYDAAEHRQLATRFGVDHGMSALCHRSWALWLLGYPLAALQDADSAVSGAPKIGRGPTLGFALTLTNVTHVFCGNYTAEAHDLLAPIYAWFTEGFDTPVLQDAKALLDELA
jgi:hypothetical protein